MDKEFIKKAIELSQKSVDLGGFPVGAIIVKEGKIVGEGLSNGKNKKDATSHAEIEAIQEASKKLGARDLVGCEIYSSMEPCMMCFSACYWAKIKKVVFAISKENLSKQHYEGKHSIFDINTKNNRQIEIIYEKDLENEALLVVKNWEKKCENK